LTEDANLDISWKKESRRACENMKLALEDAGTSTENILAMRFFLLDMKHYPLLTEVRKEYFPTRPPSMTVAVAGIGPGGKGCVEVDCIAALKM
jgi:2-iminobutanoate/2-iminopropanoate deaminase